MKQILLFCALVLSALFACAQNPPAGAASSAAPGQGPTQFAANTVLPVELTKSLDAKKMKQGDPVEAKTATDMLSQGKIVLPRGSKVVGHVTSAKAHTKDSPDSSLGIAFDHVVMKDGSQMPLPAAIQAIGAPLNQNPLATSEGVPTGGMSPGMGGGGMGGSSGMGGRAGTGGGTSQQPSSYPGVGVPTSPEGNPSGHPAVGALTASSQGVIGLKGLELKSGAQGSVITCDNKNVHLDGGTQMIIRVQ